MKSLDYINIIPSFTAGLVKAISLLGGSGASLFLSTAMPDELGLAKYASALTGWGLALACIWVLSKTVKHLFEKLEAKDKRIEELHSEALKKSDEIAEERLAALKGRER